MATCLIEQYGWSRTHQLIARVSPGSAVWLFRTTNQFGTLYQPLLTLTEEGLVKRQYQPPERVPSGHLRQLEYRITEHGLQQRTNSHEMTA